MLAQVLRLRSYPCVARRLAAGRLTVHAWYYEVHRGTVRVHDPATDAFEAL